MIALLARQVRLTYAHPSAPQDPSPLAIVRGSYTNDTKAASTRNGLHRGSVALAPRADEITPFGVSVLCRHGSRRG
jgi:hypothetical protein